MHRARRGGNWSELGISSRAWGGARWQHSKRLCSPLLKSHRTRKQREQRHHRGLSHQNGSPAATSLRLPQFPKLPLEGYANLFLIVSGGTCPHEWCSAARGEGQLPPARIRYERNDCGGRIRTHDVWVMRTTMTCAASTLGHVFQRHTSGWFLLFQPDSGWFLVDLVAVVVVLGSVLRNSGGESFSRYSAG
jgi:hypothetical protein